MNTTIPFIRKYARTINTLIFIGIGIFTLLTYYAGTQYPGGSLSNVNSAGYDWTDNYWCHLFSDTALNGQVNPSRSFAISGMIILCMTMILFYFQFAEYISTEKIWSFLIPTGGTISMLCAMFIFTSYHDLLTIISSLFGAVAVIGIIINIHHSSMYISKFLGLLCLIMIIITNIIYYTSFGIEWLPIVQKLTLVICLIWTLELNIEVRKTILSPGVDSSS